MSPNACQTLPVTHHPGERGYPHQSGRSAATWSTARHAHATLQN